MKTEVNQSFTCLGAYVKVYGLCIQAKSPVRAEPDFCPVHGVQRSCPAQFGRSLPLGQSQLSFDFKKSCDWLWGVHFHAENVQVLGLDGRQEEAS